MQRLFAMFPYGWPGRRLLLLRLGVVAILTHDGIRAWIGAPQREPIALYVVAAIAGVCLLLGLWTPVAGAIMALSEIGIVLTGAAHLQSTILFGDARYRSRISGTGLSVRRRLHVWQKAYRYLSSRDLSSRVLSVSHPKSG